MALLRHPLLSGTTAVRWLLLMGLALLAVLASPALYAQDFPKLTGRIVDEANLLDAAQKIVLETKLEGLEKQSQRQLVIVTIPDLKGYDIADYGFRLGDHWGIGNKDRDDGLLLIVAPNERKVRIEVGYGLEGVMTDALSARIIRNNIIPHFKENDFPGGINAGADAIIKLLLLPPEEARAVAQQAEQSRKGSENGEAIVFLIMFGLFFVLPMILSALSGKRGSKAYRKGGLPVILWGPGLGGGWGGGSSRSGGGWGSGGGFGGGGGGFGGGGASGGW